MVASTNIFGRIKAAGLALVGRSMTWGELGHFFGSGLRSDRPTQPYRQVGVVHACVKARAEAIAGMPLMIGTGDDQVIESGPLVELCERPNPLMTGRAFWQATSSIIDLFGSVHWIMTLDALGRPVEVVPVAPVQMEAKQDKRTGAVLGWKYRPAGYVAGVTVDLSPEEVWTIRDPDFDNPHDPLASLAPRHAVQMAISQFYKADLANEASLDNGVEPGGVFTMDGTPDETQLRDTKQQLQDRAGVKNRRRHLVLYGGMKFQQTGISFRDAEMVELKKLSRSDIAAAYGVPGPVINYFEDSNYAHARAAESIFWTGTVLPRAGRLAEEWGQAVLSHYEGDRSLRMAGAERRTLTPPQRLSRSFRTAQRAALRRSAKLYVWFDPSGVPAVQRANLEQAEQAYRWWSMGTPLNHLYAALDAPFPEVEHGNQGFKPIGLEPYGAEPMDGIDDPDGSTPGDDADTTGGDASAGSASGGVGGRSRRSPAGADAEAVRATEAQKGRLWSTWRKSWQPLERSAEKRLKSHWYALRQETLRRLSDEAGKALQQAGADELRSLSDIQRRDLIGVVLFDLKVAGDKLIASVGPLMREAQRLGGAQSMQEAADAKGADQPQPFNIDAPEVVQAMRRREVRLREVTKTVRDQVAQELAKGIDAGETTEQLAERVRTRFNFARTRSVTVARTEVGGAVEEARHEGRRQAGVPFKSWLWSRKETGRRKHAFMEVRTTETPIANDEPFVFDDGAQAQHPRATGLPEHDINCACTVLSRFEGDSVKSLLDRYTARGFLTYSQLQQRDAAGSPATSSAAKEDQA